MNRLRIVLASAASAGLVFAVGSDAGIGTRIAGASLAALSTALCSRFARRPRAARVRYRDILDASPDGMLVTDQKGRVLDANERYVRRSGYTRTELLCLGLTDLDAVEGPDELSVHLARIRRETRGVYRSRHRTKDGALWPAEVCAFSPSRTSGVLVFAVRDIVGTWRQAALLQILGQLSRRASALSTPELMRDAVDAAERLTESRDGFLHLLAEGTASVRCSVWSTSALAAAGGAEPKPGHPIRREAPSGECVRRREPVIEDGGAGEPGARCLCIPILQAAQVVGVLGLGGKAASYTPDDVTSVQEFISLALGIVLRKESDESLARERAVLRAVFSGTPDGLALKDANGVYHAANPAFCRFVGHPESEVVGRSDLELFPQAEAEDSRRSDLGVMGGRASQSQDVCMTRHGRSAWHQVIKTPILDARGRATGVLCAVQDINGRQHTEDGLRRSEERYGHLFEAMAQGVVYHDADGRVVSANPTTLEIMGVSLDALQDHFAVGFSPDGIREDGSPIPPGEHPTWVALRTAHTVRDVVLGVARPGDTRRRWILTTATPVFAADGKTTTGVFTAFTDITRQKIAEDHRNAAIEILSILNRTARPSDALRLLLGVVKRVAAVEAVGIHLRNGDDFTYLAHQGFSDDFVRKENRLCSRAPDGCIARDEHGRIKFRCICGRVISDPAPAAFQHSTAHGSAWTNHADEEAGDRVAPGRSAEPERARCILDGYASIALVPIRVDVQTIGILQLSDRRPGRFDENIIRFLEGIADSVGIAVTQSRRSAELRQREEYLRLAHDAAQAGAWEWDLRNGELLWTDSARRLYGIPPGSARPTYELWRQTIDPRDRDAADRLVQEAVRAGREVDVEWRVPLSEGGERWVMSRGRQLREASGPPTRYIGIVIDITSRKRIEEALRSSNERFEQAVSTVPVTLFNYTRDTNGIEQFTYVSPRVENLLAIDAETLLRDAKAWWSVIHPDDFGAFRSQLTASLRDDVPLDAEIRVHPLSQKPRWLEIHARRVASSPPDAPVWTGYMADVTLRKEVEEALRSSQTRFRSLVEASFDCVWETDAQGRYVYVSPKFRELLGYKPEELIGRTPSELMLPEEVQRVRAFFRRHATNREPFALLTTIHRHKDGHEVVLETSGVPVVGKDCALAGYRGIHRDVTERRKAEVHNELLRAQLLQAQKIESIGTLASGVAHEINNPIMGIMNFAELIADGAAPDSQTREFAGEIIQETNRVATIVRNLLQFACQDRPESSEARLDDIVARTLSLMNAILRRDQIIVEVTIPPDLPGIVCHPQRIEQVIMNLFTNARDALNAKHPDHDPDKIIRLSARVLNQNARTMVQTVVEDHGCGIPQEIRDRIFEPFFTTKERNNGTGLGLAISYGIVAEHGGRLSVESEAGRWTRFKMDLPVDGFVPPGSDASLPAEDT